MSINIDINIRTYSAKQENDIKTYQNFFLVVLELPIIFVDSDKCSSSQLDSQAFTDHLFALSNNKINGQPFCSGSKSRNFSIMKMHQTF
jgi:hypothetical protein